MRNILVRSGRPNMLAIDGQNRRPRRLFHSEVLEPRLVLSAPVITSVSPARLDLYDVAVATNVNFLIKGSNFDIGLNSPVPSSIAKVTLVDPDGNVEQELGNVNGLVSGATQIDLNTRDFDPNGDTPGAPEPAPGRWTVQVTNTDGSESQQFGFDVSEYYAPPVITSITPSTLFVPLQGDVTFSIHGSNFQLDSNSLANPVIAGSAGVDFQGTISGAYESAPDCVSLATATDTLLNVYTPNLGTVLSVASGDNLGITVINPPSEVSNEFHVDLERAKPPTITSQPAGQTAEVASSVTFSVTATSNVPLTYQWQYDGVAIPNATSTTLSLNNVALSQSGDYQAVVTGIGGSLTSNDALLDVTANPQITRQPQNQTVTTGASASISVSAVSPTTLAFQWEFNGASITGATLSTLALANVTAAEAGAYTVIVSNPQGSVTSTPAMLTVVDVAATPPTITTQPASQIASVGDNVTFSVAATSNVSLSYQWKFNGANLSGQTNATLALSAVTAAQAGVYTVVVSNSSNSVASMPAQLTVVQPGTLPTITTQPTSQTVTTGGTVAFSVAATSTTALQYQWQFDGANLSGQTTPTLTLANVTPGQAGAYGVIVTNSVGPVSSAPATLTVNPTVSSPNSPLSFPLTSPVAAVKVGKHGKAVLIVTNISEQLVTQSISISLLLSNDTTVAGQVAGLVNRGKKVKLKPGKSKKFALSFKVPALAAGNYKLLAQVDSGTPTVAPSPVSVVLAPVKK